MNHVNSMMISRNLFKVEDSTENAEINPHHFCARVKFRLFPTLPLDFVHQLKQKMMAISIQFLKQ